MSNHPSMLWHWFVQLTFICIALGCMFHWRDFSWDVLCRYVWDRYNFWMAVGFLLPALFQSSMVLYLEHRARRRKNA